MTASISDRTAPFGLGHSIARAWRRPALFVHRAATAPHRVDPRITGLATVILSTRLGFPAPQPGPLIICEK
jgi:hypothetical protein